MNYQSVYTVSPTAGATGVWALDGQLIPHPLTFGAVSYTDSVGIHNVEMLNSQVQGASYKLRLQSFLEDFQRWRLAYASVTIYQDGPDLANQGTVVVCQKPLEPPRFNLYDGFNGADSADGLHHAFHMEDTDLPSYAASQAMPNAYFGRSREGVYIPLKLTKTHQTWHSHRDLTYQASAAQLLPVTTTGYGGQLVLPVSADLETTGQYPFLSLNDVHQAEDAVTLRTAIVGDLTSDFCNENWADFSFKNMAVTTSLSFFFRFGFEVQVQPASILSPHLKLSPPSDPVAIETYFRIARELKDAYPADFNDAGKIWDVISSIAKTVAPFLSAVPVVGPVLPSIVSGAAGIGDRIRQAVANSSKPTLGSTMSAGDKETLQAATNPSPLPMVRMMAKPVPKRRLVNMKFSKRR